MTLFCKKSGAEDLLRWSVILGLGHRNPRAGRGAYRAWIVSYLSSRIIVFIGCYGNLFVAVQFCISPATTLEATQAYCSCGRRRVRATHRRSSNPPPVASQTTRFPVPTQPHHRKVVFSVFAPRVLCRLSPAVLYIVRHPYCSSNPPAIPCCLGTNTASERTCGSLSPTICQIAGHSQPHGAQDSTSSSLTLLRGPTMTTMPSTRKRTRAASQAGAFACALLCFVVAFFWYRSRRGREDWMMFFPHYK